MYVNFNVVISCKTLESLSNFGVKIDPKELRLISQSQDQFLLSRVTQMFISDPHPGYNGVDYCVAGLKSNQIKTEKDVYFDVVLRHEQAVIEHVNRFIKTCKSIFTVFRHSYEMLVGCILICCGMYNFKLKHGHFQ
jgi:hypothetical protein